MNNEPVEYQFYQPPTDRWVDIYNCPIAEFKKKYRGKKIRVEPVFPILEVAASVQMINRFLTIS